MLQYECIACKKESMCFWHGACIICKEHLSCQHLHMMVVVVWMGHHQVFSVSKCLTLVWFQSDGRLVGEVRLTSFNARARRDVATAITRLTQQGAKVCELGLRFLH